MLLDKNPKTKYRESISNHRHLTEFRKRGLMKCGITKRKGPLSESKRTLMVKEFFLSQVI